MAHQPPLLLPGPWYLAWCPCGWYPEYPIGGITRDLGAAERQAEGHEYSEHMPKSWRIGPEELDKSRLSPFRRGISGKAILMLHFLTMPPPWRMPDMQKNLDMDRRWGRLTGAE